MPTFKPIPRAPCSLHICLSCCAHAHTVATDFEAQQSRRRKLGQALLSHWGETGRETSDEGAMPLLLLPLQLPGAGGLCAGLRAAREERINAGIGAIRKGKIQLC